MTFGTAGTSTSNQSGTGSTTVLTACRMPGSFARQDGTVFSFVEADNDIATIQQAIKDDFNPAQPINLPMGGWSRNGQLFVPNRGWLKIYPGDLVCVDNTGFPFVISQRSAAAGNWTFTAT